MNSPGQDSAGKTGYEHAEYVRRVVDEFPPLTSSRR
jgi:hypothetical protein